MVANGGWATTGWSHQTAPNGLYVFLMEEFCVFELLLANVMRKDLLDAVYVGTEKNRHREEVIGDPNS